VGPGRKNTGTLGGPLTEKELVDLTLNEKRRPFDGYEDQQLENSDIVPKEESAENSATRAAWSLKGKEAELSDPWIC